MVVWTNFSRNGDIESIEMWIVNALRHESKYLSKETKKIKIHWKKGSSEGCFQMFFNPSETADPGSLLLAKDEFNPKDLTITHMRVLWAEWLTRSKPKVLYTKGEFRLVRA